MIPQKHTKTLHHLISLIPRLPGSVVSMSLCIKNLRYHQSFANNSTSPSANYTYYAHLFLAEVSPVYKDFQTFSSSSFLLFSFTSSVQQYTLPFVLSLAVLSLFQYFLKLCSKFLVTNFVSYMAEGRMRSFDPSTICAGFCICSTVLNVELTFFMESSYDDLSYIQLCSLSPSQVDVVPQGGRYYAMYAITSLHYFMTLQDNLCFITARPYSYSYTDFHMQALKTRTAQSIQAGLLSTFFSASSSFCYLFIASSLTVKKKCSFLFAAIITCSF